MNLSHQNFFIITLFILSVFTSEHCTLWFDNVDFMLEDYKTLQNDFFSVYIVCPVGFPAGWSAFPARRVNSLGLDIHLRIVNCAYPDGLRLANVVKSLSISPKRVRYLAFDYFHSSIKRETLSGFDVKELLIVNAYEQELSDDVLHDVRVKKFTYINSKKREIPPRFFDYTTTMEHMTIINTAFTEFKLNVFRNLTELRILEWTNGKIENIEPGAFDDLVDLEVLNLNDNRLWCIPENLFGKLAKLKRLVLSVNQIMILPPDMLINNLRLEEFNMIGNHGLESLPNGLFKDLTRLRVCELEALRLLSLPKDLFFNATSLEMLKLKQNQLTTLPGNLFESQKNLKTLWLEENVLEYLPEKLFEKTENLETLNLNRNRMKTLPRGIFKSLINLKTLSLQENVLEYLPDNLFENTKNLEAIFIYNNLLRNLTSGVLRGLNNVKTFSATYNRLTYVEPELCKYMEKLKDVDLSNNNLTMENPNNRRLSIFENCLHLSTLRISRSGITKIFPDWGSNKNLNYIDLEHNNFTHLNIWDLNVLNNGTQVNLQNNKIKTIDFKKGNNSNEFPDKYHKVLLEDNPISCDCQSLEFLQFLSGPTNGDLHRFIEFGVKDLTCASPPVLEGIILNGVPLDFLNCTAGSECSVGVLCTSIV